MSKYSTAYHNIRATMLSIVRRICGTSQVTEAVNKMCAQNEFIINRLSMLEHMLHGIKNDFAFNAAFELYGELNKKNGTMPDFDKDQFDALLLLSMDFPGTTWHYTRLLSKRGLFRDKWLKKKSNDATYLDIKGVKLTGKIPDSPEHGVDVIKLIVQRSLLVHAFFDNNYDKRIVEILEKKMGEGARCYQDGDFDVTVKAGDIVIDAGAWIGDFSAYAACKGATVYAFEPTKTTYELLCDTAELNDGKINPVNSALSDHVGDVRFLSFGNSAKNKISSVAYKELDVSQESILKATSIDAFVAENGITRVDFIKADIQGSERDMLRGAVNTLRHFGPRLAIATDHLPDDPDVLPKIILEANPNYKIVQIRTMLFAAVVEQ